MKNKIRKKLHKKMLGVLRSLNELSAKDDWLTDRYCVKMLEEYWSNEDRACRWLLAFIDKLNPLNTCMVYSDAIYYSDNLIDNKENELIGLKFIKSQIYSAFNSWLQLCERGFVQDIPSQINIYACLDKRESIMRHKTTPAKLTKEKYQLIKEKINSFDSSKYLIYDERQHYRKTDYDYKVFSPLNYLYLYKNCIFQLDDNGEIDFGIVRVSDITYCVIAEHDDIYNPKRFRNRKSMIAYEIDLEEMDETKTLTACAMLNNIKILRSKK